MSLFRAFWRKKTGVCGGYIYIYIVNPPLIPSLKEIGNQQKERRFLSAWGLVMLKEPTPNRNVFRNCSFSLELSTPPTGHKKYAQIDVISLT